MLLILRLLTGLAVLVSFFSTFLLMLFYDGWFFTSPADLGMKLDPLLHSAGWTLGLGGLLALLCWHPLISLFNRVSAIQKLSLILFFAAFGLTGLAFLSYPYSGLSADQLLRAYQWTRLLGILAIILNWRLLWPSFKAARPR